MASYLRDLDLWSAESVNGDIGMEWHLFKGAVGGEGGSRLIDLALSRLLWINSLQNVE